MIFFPHRHPPCRPNEITYLERDLGDLARLSDLAPFKKQPYYVNLTSQVVKTPKYYWGDLGVLRHLTGQFQMTTGALFETYVVGEINKWVKTSSNLIFDLPPHNPEDTN